MSDAAKRKIAGIDLGTTYSAIAHFDEYGKVDIIPNSDNERITPSVILFEDDEVIVGKIAKNQAVSNPENVVQFVKRHMGEPDWVRTITGREYTPEILSAIILKRIVSDAEDQIGEKITDVVITCPAYFNDNERKATSDSGKIAGLNVLGIINEPTAAAIAYGMNNLDREVTALVYDLGGGTFDVTLLKIDGNNVNVLATDGERRLGGKDWDDMLLNHVADKFMDEHQIDPRDDAEAYQDLIIKVEEAKKALSKKPVAKVFAQCGGKSLKLSISREEFEELTLPLVEQTETYLDVVLKKADLSWDKIDVVIHVGGSTRMPAIRDMLQRVTGKDPEKGVNPDECVAIGAAYWAAIRMVREANQAKEAAESGDEGAASKAEETAKAVEESVPEDIVGMLGGVTVTNVNSHSLGIVTVQANGNERNLVMIPEQSSLPCTVTKIFGTYQDNQVTIQVKILEGESPDPSECTEIGMCVISDLPPDRPKGSKISVTYQYGEDGRIEIKARDHQTGQEARTEIKRDAEGLSDDEMEQKGAEIARLLEVGPEETYADGGYEAAAAPTAEAAAPAAAPEAAAPAGDAAGYEGAAGYTAAAYGAEGYGAAAYGAEGYGAAAAGYGAEGYAAAGYGAAAYGAEAGAAAAGYGAEGAAAAGYGAEAAAGYGAEGAAAAGYGAEGYAGAAYGAEGAAAAGYGAEGAAAAGYGAEGYAGAAYGAEGAAAGYGAEGYATEGGQAYGAEYAEGAYGAEQSGYTAEGYGGEYAEGGYGDEGFADSADQSAR